MTTVLLYETKFQLRNRTTFFWLRLLLPFFFYDIDSVGVYVVCFFEENGPETVEELGS